MPFRLEINVCNDPFPHGSPTTLEEGRHGSATFESAGECNAAAKQALNDWLAANCSAWTEDGVTSGTFEGDDSGARARLLGQHCESASHMHGCMDVWTRGCMDAWMHDACLFPAHGQALRCTPTARRPPSVVAASRSTSSPRSTASRRNQAEGTNGEAPARSLPWTRDPLTTLTLPDRLRACTRVRIFPIPNSEFLAAPSSAARLYH